MSDLNEAVFGTDNVKLPNLIPSPTLVIGNDNILLVSYKNLFIKDKLV